MIGRGGSDFKLKEERFKVVKRKRGFCLFLIVCFCFCFVSLFFTPKFQCYAPLLDQRFDIFSHF